MQLFFNVQSSVSMVAQVVFIFSHFCVAVVLFKMEEMTGFLYMHFFPFALVSFLCVPAAAYKQYTLIQLPTGRGVDFFIRHQDLMHPSSESFSFGTLKDIRLFCLKFHILSFTTTQRETKEQEKKNKERLRLCLRLTEF